MFVWFFTAERLSQKLFTQSKLLLTLLEVNQRTKKCVSVPPKSLRFTCSQYFKGMTGISSSYIGLNETPRSQTVWTEILVAVSSKHGWVFNHLDMFCYDRCLICCQLSPNLMNSSCHFINTRHLPRVKKWKAIHLGNRCSSSREGSWWANRSCRFHFRSAVQQLETVFKMHHISTGQKEQPKQVTGKPVLTFWKQPLLIHPERKRWKRMSWILD